MGYKFELKQAGDAVNRGFSEPIDSSLVSKWPCKKSSMVYILVGFVICLSIGVGVGIHIFEKKQNEKGNQPVTKSPANDSELPAPNSCPWGQENSPVILISIGGLRSDYQSKNITPTLSDIAHFGVSTSYMLSVNPTLTLPNLFSIVSGLYPESHGVVDNVLPDIWIKELGKVREDYSHQRMSAEPIWLTLRRQNKITASIGWPGTDANLLDSGPIVLNMNSTKNSLLKPVQEIFRWLRLPNKQRPNLILWYIDKLVITSQRFGPNSPLVDDKLGEIDDAIRYLLTGLQRNSLKDCVNLMIVSDHGMARTSSERVFNTKTWLTSQDWSVLDNAFTVVHAKHNVTSNAVEDLAKSIECQNQYVKVFTKSSVPKRYHVFNNPRSADLLLLANNDWLSSRSGSHQKLGSSGYDSRDPNMRAIFMAVGPSFRNHLKIKPFENIELYNMMSELLRMKPSPNNGTVGSLSYILRNTYQYKRRSKVVEFCQKTENWSSVFKHLKETSCNIGNTSVHIISKLKEAQKHKATVLDRHVPFGAPVETDIGTCHSLLYQTDFVAGTRKDYLMPIWSSATLGPETAWAEQKEVFPHLNERKCLFTDARLPIEYWKKDYHKQELGFLQNLDFLNVSEAHLTSNTVPMLQGFRNGIWRYLWQILKQYSEFENINIVVGPVFDKDHDGIEDRVFDSSYLLKPSYPSHFFVVLSKCQQKRDTNFTKCLLDDRLDILAFVLPHRNKTDNCMNYGDFLEEHLVRIRDIELLTGLLFFQPYQDDVNVLRQRLYLPASLWKSPATEKWLKQPCLSNQESLCPRDPTVLLISLSGFSPSHLAYSRTPVLEKLRNCGTQSQFMRPVYPSNSIPNIYSIVTGLYPESHGMLSNYTDQILKRENKERLNAEPIWITAEKQNKSTAVCMWPGEISYQGIKPSKWIPFSSEVGFGKRIQIILDWLSLSDDDRPDFIFAHFGDLDRTLHRYGANNHQIEKTLANIDKSFSQLFDGIKERKLEQCVDLIVISDHGIQSTSIRRQINLDAEVVSSYVIEGATIYQKPEVQKVEINKTLEAITGSPVRIYTKATFPRRFHFNNNAQIGDVQLILEDGWIVKSKERSKSAHGYDNRFKSMQAIFLAYGPSFRNNFTIGPFENIEIYNLLTDLLHIQPVANNGTEGTLNKILKKPKAVLQHTKEKNISCCLPEPLTNDNCTYSYLKSFKHHSANVNHVPFGVPTYETYRNSCILHTDNFSLIRQNEFQIPIWFSFNALQQNSSRVMNGILSECSSLENKDSNMTIGNLFLIKDKYNEPLGFLPMYKGFKEGIWKEVHNLIHDYTIKYPHLNVAAGPIFEHGLSEANMFISQGCKLILPTHFYLILSKFCSSSDERSCKEGSIEVLPFILPHVEKDPNNLKARDYLFDHTARIRDIEHLTGLTFMTSRPWQESLETRTQLPLEMWEGVKPSSWMKLPACKNLDSLCKNDQRPILLISLDGFQSEYLHYNVTPVINRLRNCGVQTSYMQSSFPSKTFPNHYTIATGLYPESHGIVGNLMYNMKTNKVFTMASTEPEWWGGEPIWKTMSKAGKESASYFFVGSSISGSNATYYYTYSESSSFISRIEQVVKWLKKGIPFVSVYFEEPDSTGHNEGPFSKQIINTLRNVDSYIGRLMDKLYSENLHNCVNIIIVSDHGMSDIRCERSIVIQDMFDDRTINKKISVFSDGRLTNKYWQPKRKVFKKVLGGKDTISISELMHKLECKSRHMKVYQKEFLPKRLHYSSNPLIGEIQLLVDDKWFIQRSKTLYCRSRGSHGYDNRFKSMNALFVAYGPDFKQQLKVKSFQNIEIYNLLTDMLNITGAPNNGTKGRLHGLLRRPPPEPLRHSIGQYVNVTFNQTPDELTLFLKEQKCFNSVPTNEEVSLLHDSLVNPKDVKFPEVFVGLPLLKTKVSILLLRYNSYLTGYDSSSERPLFLVATGEKPQHRVENKADTRSKCFPDPRIHETQPKFDNTTHLYKWLNLASTLFLSNEDRIHYLSSSLIRVSKTFKEVLWAEILKVLQKWRSLFFKSTWFVGPVFDYDLDGRADSKDTINRFTNESLPTHVFLVLVGRNKTNKIQATTAYIIPSNQHHLPKCRRISQLVRDHQARVRDVELLTNLEFFPDEKFSTAVIHRTSFEDLKLQ